MAIINPAGWLQNAGATHTAEQQRNWQSVLLSGKTGSTSLMPRGGVNPGLGNMLVITQLGSPAMGIIVKSGLACIPGTEGGKQGTYSVLNDGDIVLSLSAAHATLNRIDLVVLKVEDQGYSGAVNAASVAIVTGTPASSPAAPSPPNNSITLAQIFVGANVTQILTANITDKRPFLAAAGGFISVADATERNALAAYDSLGVYRRDTDTIEIYDGSAWDSFTNSQGRVIARGRRTTGSLVANSAAQVPVQRLDSIPLLAGHAYMISCGKAGFTASDATQRPQHLMYINNAGAATTGSTLLREAAAPVYDTSVGTVVPGLDTIYVPAGNETLSVLYAIARVAGSGSVTYSPSTSGPCDIWVTDLGTDPGDSGIDL